MKMRLQVDMPKMDLPENGLKWICNKDGLKVDLPEKWIENGFARKMDSTNFQFDDTTKKIYET